MVFCRRAAESKHFGSPCKYKRTWVYILLYDPHLRNSSQSLVNHKNREAIKKSHSITSKVKRTLNWISWVYHNLKMFYVHFEFRLHNFCMNLIEVKRKIDARSGRAAIANQNVKKLQILNNYLLLCALLAIALSWIERRNIEETFQFWAEAFAAVSASAERI